MKLTCIGYLRGRCHAKVTTEYGNSYERFITSRIQQRTGSKAVALPSAMMLLEGLPSPADETCSFNASDRTMQNFAYADKQRLLVHTHGFGHSSYWVKQVIPGRKTVIAWCLF